MISMITLNARLQTAMDGANAFIHRKDILLQSLRRQAADVIGFQELTHGMLEAFRKGLPEYGFIGRSSKARNRGEYTAIAYRKDTLLEEEHDTFWLSPLPSVPGSRFLLQSPDARTCTWATFIHKATGIRFRYFNTHLDHLSPMARMKGVLIIGLHIAECQRTQRLPLFWGGDFNFTPRSKLYALCTQMQGEGAMVDLTADISSTFNWFGALKRPMKLDYILTDTGTAGDAFEIDTLREAPDGRYLSDHDAIRLDWTPGANAYAQTAAPLVPQWNGEQAAAAI